MTNGNHCSRTARNQDSPVIAAISICRHSPCEIPRWQSRYRASLLKALRCPPLQHPADQMSTFVAHVDAGHAKSLDFRETSFGMGADG
jgi:hypothetical protein